MTGLLSINKRKQTDTTYTRAHAFHSPCVVCTDEMHLLKYSYDLYKTFCVCIEYAVQYIYPSIHPPSTVSVIGVAVIIVTGAAGHFQNCLRAPPRATMTCHQMQTRINNWLQIYVKSPSLCTSVRKSHSNIDYTRTFPWINDWALFFCKSPHWILLLNDRLFADVTPCTNELQFTHLYCKDFKWILNINIEFTNYVW